MYYNRNNLTNKKKINNLIINFLPNCNKKNVKGFYCMTLLTL